MSHTCHAYRCQTSCPPRMLMCKKHWFMVPKAMQDAVWAAYRHGQERDKNPSAEWLLACTRAQNAVGLKEGIIDQNQAAQAELRYRRKLEQELSRASIVPAAQAIQPTRPQQAGKEIYGLSLWRPWPWAFVTGPEHQQKRVENRTWRPPAGVEWLALHAAKRWDAEGADYIQRATGLQVPPDSEHPSGQIFAVCRLTHVFEMEFPADIVGYPDCVSLWAFGPFCWVVDDVLPLVNPVPCPGAQGLWKLSGRPGLLEQVRAAYTESIKARKVA